MTAVLLGIALKSLIVAALTVGALAVMKRRSAAERSWVAHIGLLALVLLAIAPLALPRWTVEMPAFGSAATPIAATAPAIPIAHASTSTSVATSAPAMPTISAAAAATMVYAVPAAILLLITLIALARLLALRARAEVLVDGHWLSAMARAQRRMGFKHGTALLTSDELSSPISWGVMRPVILLNSRAVEATGEAEAIIAHELAHVARLDWAKLLLARIATALFWFNPLVWVLAREAHQLREETADDAVLAADIADTDYAQLLVGVARHECPGLLLGAHGVAPSKGSLARRVRRVLDGQSVRGPAARPFAIGVFVGAVIVAAPLAALTLAPAGSSALKEQESKGLVSAAAKPLPQSAYYPVAREVPTDLPSIIADGVTTAVSTVVPSVGERRDERIANALEAAGQIRSAALAQAGRAVADAQAQTSGIDRIVALRAVGVTPDYVAQMRAVSPLLRSVSPGEFVGLQAVGVTPQYARDLASAGFPNLSADDLQQARAVGVTGDYARAMAAAGVRPGINSLIELRAVGVPPDFPQTARRQGYDVRDPENLVELWVVGGDHNARVRAKPPRPPSPPRRTEPDDGG